MVLFRRALIFIGLLVTFVSTSAAEKFEYQLKAEFIERFTRFIDWPSDSPHDPSPAYFDIAVIGVNPFGQYLNDMSRQVKIHGKPVRVHEVKKIEELKSCDLLFVSQSEEKNLDRILSFVDNKPILTVSDTPGFARRGVMINFFDERGFVRFEVNTKAVRTGPLKFSSRLLKLARLVGEEDEVSY